MTPITCTNCQSRVPASQVDPDYRLCPACRFTANPAPPGTPRPNGPNKPNRKTRKKGVPHGPDRPS